MEKYIPYLLTEYQAEYLKEVLMCEEINESSSDLLSLLREGLKATQEQRLSFIEKYKKDIMEQTIQLNTEFIKRLPRYVRMERSTCLELDPGEMSRPTYFRSAGNWYVYVEERDGKLFSLDPYDGQHPQLNNNELVAITKEKWGEDNFGPCISVPSCPV